MFPQQLQKRDSSIEVSAQSEQGKEDEDDYADEEVEEDEDSCANVDTSKTFEEIACSGGACQKKLPQTDQQQQQQLPKRGEYLRRPTSIHFTSLF